MFLPKPLDHEIFNHCIDVATAIGFHTLMLICTHGEQAVTGAQRIRVCCYRIAPEARDYRENDASHGTAGLRV